MKRPRHSRLEELFEAALDLETGKRTAYIDEHCAGNPSLRKQLCELVHADRLPTGSLLKQKPIEPDIDATTTPGPRIDVGTTVGSYRIVEKLDEGGMGVIYVAQHEDLDTRVAVKVLRDSLSRKDDMGQRFQNEAKAAASIGHPGIVKVFDAGRHESGNLYIIMELLSGESLKQRLKSKQRLPEEIAVSFVRQAARALAAAHRQNIIHRDLKPDNLFLVPDPEVVGGERIKVLDFGIAKLAEDRAELVTKTNMVMGTPPYMSPEQCRGAGDVDHRADLYSLGVILFEMLCGRWPFIKRGLGEYLDAHMNDAPPPVTRFNVDVSAATAMVVERLLAKSPAERYQSANDLVAALDNLPTIPDSPLLSAIVRKAATPASWPGTSRPAGRVVATDDADSVTRNITPARDRGAAATDKAARAALAQDTTMLASGGATQKAGDATRSAASMDTPPTPARERMETTMRHATSVVMATVRSPLRLARHVPAGGLAALAIAALLVFGISYGDMGIIEKLRGYIAGFFVVNAGPSDINMDSYHSDTLRPPVPGKNGDKPLFKDSYHEIRDILDNARIEVQLDAIRALEQVGSERSAPLLYQALQEGPQQVRLEAARALVALDWPSAAPKVREAMGRASGPLRVQLAACLMQLGDPDGRNVLENELNTDGSRALDAAVALAMADEHGQARRYLKNVLRDIPAGRDNWHRAAAALLARGDAQAEKQLGAELARPEPARALAAARILASAGREQGIAYLRRVVADPDFALRGEAALALARAHGKSALDFVKSVLQPGNGPQASSATIRERQLAVAVAGRLAGAGGAAYAQQITRLASADKDSGVRIVAHAALIAFANNHINEE